MKNLNRALILTALILLLIPLTVALAETGESSGNIRQIYDVVMRWANFLILAFIIVKFSRVPLKNFLRLQRDEVGIGITRLEDEKTAALEKINEIRTALDNSHADIRVIQKRIIAQGEREKLKRIQEAHQHSEIFLKNTRRKIDTMVILAHDAFKMELLDSALEMTIERLPSLINEEDNQLFFDRYIESTDSLKKLSA